MISEGFFNSKTLLKKLKEKFSTQVEDVTTEISQIRIKFKNSFQEIRELLDLKEHDFEAQLICLNANESEMIYSDIEEINKTTDLINEITSILHFILHSKNKAYLANLMFLQAKIDDLTAKIQELQSFKRLSNKYDFDLSSLDQLKQTLIKTNFIVQNIEIPLKSARKKPAERSNTPKTPYALTSQPGKEYKSLVSILDSTRNTNIPENTNLSAKGRKFSNHSQISHQNSLSILDITETENKNYFQLPFSEEINKANMNSDIAILRNRNVSPFRSKFNKIKKILRFC